MALQRGAQGLVRRRRVQQCLDQHGGVARRQGDDLAVADHLLGGRLGALHQEVGQGQPLQRGGALEERLLFGADPRLQTGASLLLHA